MTGCATTYRAGAPKGAVDVIGHRGASAYAPENTLSSFRLAKELKADWFELDVTLTKDGQVLVIHDDKLDRTTNGKGKAGAKTLAELKQLDAGSWKDPKFAGEKLPTLAEALDLAKELKIGVYIEIKNADDDTALIRDIVKMAGDAPVMTRDMKREMMAKIRASKTRNLELTEKTIDLVRKRRMARQVVIQSFSPIACAITICEAPRFRTEMLALKDDDNPQRWPLYLRWMDLMKPSGFNTNPKSFEEPVLRKCQAEGRHMAIWTLDEEAEIRHFAELGVTGIITNKPDLALKVLKEMRKR